MKPRFFLILAVLLCTFACAATSSALDFSALENTPIQEGGRKKPFYTFATETLQTISGKSAWTDPATGERRPAMDVVLAMWSAPESWQSRPVILVGYQPLRKQMGLASDCKLFSLQELSGNAALQQQLEAAQKLEMSQESTNPKLTPEQTEARHVAGRVKLLQSVLSGAAFAFVPNPASATGAWLTPGQAASAYPGKAGETVETQAAELLRAFGSGESAAFAAASSKFSSGLAELRPQSYPSAGLMELEVFYGKLRPFRWAWVLYAMAGVVLWLTTLAGRTVGYRTAWALILAGFTLQLFGFVARIAIGGRGPVTNMYESVIWVAFGTILFAIVMEAIYRSRVMFLGATPVAVTTLILADTQTTVLNASIHPLTPVLRDNFWLSTHVTSITLSYAAFALALGVGHIVLGKILFGRKPTDALYNYLYRSLQIGVLLLAIGTILGGVWANYSWGRFWDWDPKETWALIALLGYLAVLHGRLAGWWQGFGLAVGSICAFQSVLMAWYGVNFVLGEGKHSYGFGAGGFSYVLGYVVAELAFVALVITRRAKKTPVPAKVEPRKEAAS